MAIMMTNTNGHLTTGLHEILRAQFSPRVAAIIRIVAEEAGTVDSIRTGHIAFHFSEESQVKSKLSNEMRVTFDGALAVRST